MLSSKGSGLKPSSVVIRQLVGKLFGLVSNDTATATTIFSPQPNTTFSPQNLLPAASIAAVESITGHRIRNVAYFEQALLHRSYLQVLENKEAISNERLEFLGDSILNMLIGEFLFHRYHDIQEGELTKLRSRLVNRKALMICARSIQLERYMLLNTSANQSISQGNDSLLADGFEALLAALYLDSGSQLGPVKDFLARTLLTPEMFEKILFIEENYKSILLEHLQASGMGIPRYVVVSQEGPDHERVFTVQVITSISEEPLGSGTGRSKKQAEQAAAAEAVERMNIQVPANGKDGIG